MIYMHVGFPKAASTTIQHFLAANSEFLAKHDLVYPQISPTRESSYGSSMVAHNPLAIELRRGAPGAAWQRLIECVDDRSKGGNIALSGEGLSNCKPKMLKRALKGHEIKIIFYIREFSKIVVSQYSQATKKGASTADFDTFMEANLARIKFRLQDYFARWAAVFGARNIKVRQLDNRTLVGGDVRIDILDALEIDHAKIDATELEMTEDANTSPGWKTLEILRDLNSQMSEKFIADTDEKTLREAKRSWRRRNTPGKEIPLLDFTAFIWFPAARIGQLMGFTERGLYMSEEQYERCNTGFDEQVDALNALGMDTRLVHAARESFVPRSFMPSIEHIPAEEVAAFLRRLAPVGWWSLISGERRVSVLIKGSQDRDAEDRYDEEDEEAALNDEE